MRIFASLVTFCVACLPAFSNPQGGLAAVSLRKYQVEGKSNVHLYLYRLDGTLVKVLTNGSGIDDENPIFSSDGRFVLFKRTATDSAGKKQDGQYVVNTETGEVHLYDYIHDQNAYYASLPVDRFHLEPNYPAEYYFPGWLRPPNEGTFLSSDGHFKLIRKKNADQSFTELISEDNGKPVPISALPGLVPPDLLEGIEPFEVCNESPFVSGGNFEAVFLDHHLNSTDRSQLWALDLHHKKWTKVSQNGATIFHPASTEGTFVVSDSLYQPLGTKGMTVNCSYLEWWNAQLEMTMLAPQLSVFYGATIFHPPDEVLEIR